MKKTESELEVWTKEALAVPSGDLISKVPLYVLFGEAVDVAKFVDRYWKPADGPEGARPGLDSCVPKGRAKGRISAKTGAEILSLGRAAHDAHTRYLLAVEPRASGEWSRCSSSE